MAQKDLWNLASENMLQDRGVLPEEEGDVITEYQAMHEENFLSSWLREGWERTRWEEEWRQKERETEEEKGKKRTREKEKNENETVSAKRRCVGFISAEGL